MNIEFTDDHIKGQNQAYIALSGSKEGMIEDLEAIIHELKTGINKPIQGVTIHFNNVRQVITPFWDGKIY
jgi:hypothetical protein